MKILMGETDIRVGSKFLYNGHDQQYTTDDKGVHALRQFSPPDSFEQQENRSARMIRGLNLALGEHYTVQFEGCNYSRHCPFSGGGDISIFKSTCSAAVVNLHPSGIPPDDDTTPTKPGEYKCVSIENKIAGHLGREVEQKNVTLQLQANMLLLSTTLLVNKIKECPNKAEGINILTCYGLQIGLDFPLKILKLTIDFSENTMEYKELLNVPPTALHHAYIDLALQYVVDCL